jgi:hypothetical protein
MKYIKIFIPKLLYVLFMIVLPLLGLRWLYNNTAKSNFDEWHWLQTRGETEKSGTAILKQCEIEHVVRMTYYRIKLEGQNNRSSINQNYLDDLKVFNILKDIPLGSEIPVRWVTKENGETILTAINNETKIGNNSYWLLFIASWFGIGLFIIFRVNYIFLR